MEILIPVAIVALIGLAAGLILAVASKFLSVPVDERIEKVRDALPGANCGGCGFSGCDGYASAIVNDGADVSLCGAGGVSAAKQIASIMGVEAGDVKRKVAVVRCTGSNENEKAKYIYHGLNSCRAAAMLNDGPGACGFGCIGFGDCVGVCENDAIKVVNGVAVVNSADCGACGKCVHACPHGVIAIAPVGTNAVRCSSAEKGAVTRKACSAGCIGCMKCTKVCEYGAVKVENFLATIDPQKCNGCGKCEEACPSKVIHMIR